VSCFTCKWYKPIPPSDWEPAYPGQEFSIYHVLKPLADKQEYVWTEYPGDCTCAPQHEKTVGGNLCAKYDCFKNPTTISCSFVSDYRARGDYNELKEQNKKLKKVAVERWKKLQENKK
jgi:hypothetical protein